MNCNPLPGRLTHGIYCFKTVSCIWLQSGDGYPLALLYLLRLVKHNRSIIIHHNSNRICRYSDIPKADNNIHIAGRHDELIVCIQRQRRIGS